jgi:formate dehydrogenase maturation protein FdhE
MTFAEYVEDSGLEFEEVKFCPSCLSDNVQQHPDDHVYRDSHDVARWLKCETCSLEFQVWQAEQRVSA